MLYSCIKCDRRCCFTYPKCPVEPTFIPEWAPRDELVMSLEIEMAYTKETGKSPTYKIGASDYHTLRYVRWLEKKLISKMIGLNT